MTRSLLVSVLCAAGAGALQPAARLRAAGTRLHAANIQYGDTGGAALVLDDLSVRRGPVELVSGATWTIMPGERWGIVGPNGAGKSTLLGAILGIHDMTTGHVAVKTDADVGDLEQTGVGGSDTSGRTEVMSRMGALAEAQKALTEATERVEGGDYSEEALEALRPLEIDPGIYVRERFGYRVHTDMTRFRWKAVDVEEAIEKLPARHMRRALAVWNYLIENDKTSEFTSWDALTRHLIAGDEDKIELADGSYVISKVMTAQWTYSEKLEAKRIKLEEQKLDLKTAEKKEQLNGSATATFTAHVRGRAK